MKRIFALLILGSMAVSCRSTSVSRQPQSEEYGFCPQLEVQTLSFDALAMVIRSRACNIRTISSLLDRLPAAFRENYALFFRSRSLQGPHETDYLNPRVILFGPPGFGGSDGRHFIFSFNNEAHHAGSNSLEFLEVNTKALDVRDMFRFGEIDFPVHESDLNSNSKKISWEQAQEQIHFSGFNPPRCTRCHGDPARPIFPGYPIWEGAFGSKKIKLPAEEVKGYLAFLDRAERVSGANRYSYLVRPYGDTKQKLANLSAKPELLNQDLGYYNGFRVARLAEASPQFDRFKFAIAGALNRCDAFPKFFPEPLLADLYANLENRWKLKSKWNPQNLESFQRKFHGEKDYVFLFVDDVLDSREVNGKYQSFHRPFSEFKKLMMARSAEDERFLRLLMDTVSVQGISRGDILGANLRLVMEGRGLNIDNWFLDLTQPTYRFQAGLHYETSLEALVEKNPDLPPDLHKPESDAEENCKVLQQKSLVALQGVRAPLVFSPEDIQKGKYPLTFTKVCAQCHDDPAVPLAPVIPFNDPNKFNAWLMKAGNRKLIRGRVFSPDENYRMPPTKRLTREELQHIGDYLGRGN